MSRAFRIVNVFTRDGAPLSGNPLCVFEDARGLDAATMQALALQLNLSETTFVLPPTDPARADAHVRIFTPTFEIPFAGHPTLGTASVLLAAHGDASASVTLELAAGLVEVTRSGDLYTLRTARAPRTRPPEAPRETLAAMLGLPPEAIADAPHWVDTGVEQLMIPLTSAEHVRAAVPDPALLLRWGCSEGRREAMVGVWAIPSSEQNDQPWNVRFFFTVHGAVIEDPATGSACANLGGWWLARGLPLPLAATLHQGDAVGRPSRLHLAVGEDGAIRVAGACIEVARGAFSP
jgi:trans-2,3-dihydro-3-hydroxyanthranilate isomerase